MTCKTCQFGPRCWGICGFVSLACALVFLSLGIWSTHLDQRFTPVYTPITCHMGAARVQGFNLGQTITLQMKAATTCQNPNEYSITLASLAGGNVYLGENRTQVARLTSIPQTLLPANGQGKIEAHVAVNLSFSEVPVLLPLLGAREIPVYFTNNVGVHIDVSFLLGRWRTFRTFSKKCGFNMEGPGSSLDDLLNRDFGASLGQIACADSYGGLQLPQLGESGSRELTFFAGNIAPQEVERAESIKEASLTAAQALFYSLFGVLSLLALFCAWRFLRVRRQLARDAGEDGKGFRGKHCGSAVGETANEPAGAAAATAPIAV